MYLNPLNLGRVSLAAAAGLCALHPAPSTHGADQVAPTPPSIVQTLSPRQRYQLMSRANACHEIAAAADTQPGGRLGVHGMVVFGSPQSGLYMSHIPMFHRPHDVQAVFKVTFPTDSAFEDGLYTFQPEKFSLDDLLDGRLDHMKGTLYRGSFEGDGKPIKDVDVKVERVLSTALLQADGATAPYLEYRVVGTPRDAYLVHPIGRAPDFDQIVRLDLSHSTLTAADIQSGVTVVMPGRLNQVQDRLIGGVTHATVVGTQRDVDLAVDRVLSTLVGPDFTDPPK